MAKVGSVVIDIVADTQHLIKGLNKATKSFNKFSKNISTATQAFAGIFASYKIYDSISKTTKEIDKLAKTSSKLGMSVEALQGLQYAADVSGVSVSTLNLSLQRMTRRVSEAAQGTGEAAMALAELNINAAELNALSPDEQLRVIAESMAKVGNQSDKVRLAMKLFDTEGVNMVNMLKGGKDGLDKLTNEMAGLGVITAKEAARTEAFNDAWTKVSTQADILGKKLFISLLPALEEVVNGFNTLTTNKSAISSFFDGVGFVVFRLTKEVYMLDKALRLAGTGWEMLANAYQASGIGGATEDERAIAEKRMIELSKESLSIQKAIGAEWESFLSGPVKDISILKPNTDSSGNLGINGSLKEQITLFDALKKASQKYYFTMESSTKQANDILNQTTGIMVNGITSGFRKMMDGAADWGETFKSIIKDIIAGLIRVLFVQKAVNNLVGLFGGVGASGAGAGTGSVTAFAKGGVVSAPTAFNYGNKTGIMGERGPEAIVPLKRDSSGALGVGSSPVTVNVMNNTSSDVSVQDRGDGNIDIVVSQVALDIQRGTGPIPQAMEVRYGLSKR